MKFNIIPPWQFQTCIKKHTRSDVQDSLGHHQLLGIEAVLSQLHHKQADPGHSRGALLPPQHPQCHVPQHQRTAGGRGGGVVVCNMLLDSAPIQKNFWIHALYALRLKLSLIPRSCSVLKIGMLECLTEGHLLFTRSVLFVWVILKF